MASVRVVHLSSVHPRHDVRVFHKEAVSVAKNYETFLVLADGEGNAVKGNVSIVDVGRPKSRIVRLLLTTWLVFFKAYALKASLYHFHDPELIPMALILKLLGKKVIFDMHENTDLQLLEKPWIPTLVRRPLSKVYSVCERIACSCFDHVVVPQYVMKDKYKLGSKTTVICNFPSSYENDAILSDGSRFELIYSGSVSNARGFENMLSLIEELIGFDSRYVLKIAGKLSENQIKKVDNSIASENIYLLGYLTKEELYRAYSTAGFGLILFNNVGQYGMAYALKLFEYMQNGLLVVMPNFGDWLTFNEDYQAGITIDPSNSKEIASQIHALSDEDLASIRASNKRLVSEVFTWSSQENKLFETYRAILE